MTTMLSLKSAIYGFDQVSLPACVASAHAEGILEQSSDTGLQSETPLHLSVRIRNLPAVQQILAYPIDCNRLGIFLQCTSSGMFRQLKTALQLAVEAGNTGTTILLLDKNASQHIPETYLNCRDLAADLYSTTLNPCYHAVWEQVVHAKVEKDLSKLSAHGAIALDKTRELLTDLVYRESLCKNALASGNFRHFASPIHADNHFYIALPIFSEQAPLGILKAKQDFGTDGHWETFMYRLALLMQIGELFIPTKKISVLDPQSGKPLKMVMQPYMDQTRYLKYSPEWGHMVPMNSYIKALLTQMCFILGDSFEFNLRFDIQTKEIVHFDLDYALTETNTYLDNGELETSFQTCLISMPQAHQTLSPQDIACVKYWLDHLVRHFPQALSYFDAHYDRTMKRIFPDAPSDEEITRKAWNDRMASMQEALEKIEGGSITNLADFTLECFPAYKVSTYANLAFSILQQRISNPDCSIDSFPFDLPSRGLASTMQEFAKLGIPFQSFEKLLSLESLNLDLQAFIDVCFSFPIVQSPKPVSALEKIYQRHAAVVEKGIQDQMMAERGMTLSHESEHA